ncbi:MAG: PLP-dependent transferase [Acidimicrobiia bacterium]
MLLQPPFFSTAIFDVEGGQATRVNTLEIMRLVLEDESRHALMERGPGVFCIGWTSYPRFAPTKYEIDLVNHYLPKTVALPFPSKEAAQRTLDGFRFLLPSYDGPINIVNPENTDIYFLEFPGLESSSKGVTIFKEIREAREYLGTGMSPRQAHFELMLAQGKISPLAFGQLSELQTDINRNYRQQFARILKSGKSHNIYVRPNGTDMLVDILESIKMAVKKDDLKVATSGVPYSDTPITIGIVTGEKPTNTRSQMVSDVIDAALDADVIMLELGDNPLLTSTDIESINAFAKEVGKPIFIDVSVVGPGNIDYAKLFSLEMVAGAIASTTKYSSGTVMGGMFIRNPNCKWEHQTLFKDYLDDLRPKADMYFADGTVHLRDLATYSERLKAHNRNAQELAEMLKDVPGLNVNYPTVNGYARNIEPFLKDGAGFGGLLSIEFSRELFSEEEVLKIVNELPNNMTNALSFGLPFSVALPYAATVFPEQTKEVSGCDPLILRLSMGAHPGESSEVYSAIMSTLYNVVGRERFHPLDQPAMAL